MFVAFGALLRWWGTDHRHRRLRLRRPAADWHAGRRAGPGGRLPIRPRWQRSARWARSGAGGGTLIAWSSLIAGGRVCARAGARCGAGAAAARVLAGLFVSTLCASAALALTPRRSLFSDGWLAQRHQHAGQVVFHQHGQVFLDGRGQARDQRSSIRAGIKQFPYRTLRYECGMGKCSKCACRVLAGAEHLPPPNWKEKKQLGEQDPTRASGSPARSGSRMTSSWSGRISAAAAREQRQQQTQANTQAQTSCS